MDVLRREALRTIAGNALSFGQFPGPTASPRTSGAIIPKVLAGLRLEKELNDSHPGWNNAGDARRHGELSRRMTTEIGPVSSAIFGLGHELEGSLIKGQALSEAVMDTINNAEGLRAGLEGRQPDPRRLQTRPSGPAPAGSPYATPRR